MPSPLVYALTCGKCSSQEEASGGFDVSVSGRRLRPSDIFLWKISWRMTPKVEFLTMYAIELRVCCSLETTQECVERKIHRFYIVAARLHDGF